MIRVGIAGIGFMGMVHYLSYQKLRGVKVVALCEQNRKRLAGDWRDIQGNFGPRGEQIDLSGVATYTDLNEMLADDSVDLVDITLPPALHADIAVRAVARGKHVFSEKPMALAVADCRRMQAAAKKARRQLLVGHVLPFFPEYAWALAAIRSGKYGRVRGGSFKRVISEPLWLKSFWVADQVGGPMLDLHIHDAHFIRLVFGMPAGVVTRGTTKQGLAKNWHSLFDFADPDCIVEATSGTIDQQGRSFNHGFEIRLERATLLFEFAVFGGAGRYLCPPTILDAKGNARVVDLAGGDPMDAFEAELKEVAACISKDYASDILNATLALDAIRLCHAQSESLLKHRPVRIQAR
ncbi:MAG: Gfo/Idh/MocA family protein [Pirellulales bacterium]